MAQNGVSDGEEEEEATEERAPSSLSDTQPLLPRSNVSTPGAPMCCSARYNLAVLSFLGFFMVYALRVNLSVALVAMVNHTTDGNVTAASPWHAGDVDCPGRVVDNGTDAGPGRGPKYNWDVKTQGWILSAFFYGYIITQVPGGYLAGRYGGKMLFGIGVACTTLLTLATPPAASFGVPWLIVVRVIEGFGEGATFPTMHAMWAHWAPPLERSRLLTISYAGAQFGTVVSLPLSGLLIDTLGWPSVFYIFGGLGVAWCVLWFLLAWDTPDSHPHISEQERSYIKDSLRHMEHGEGHRRVPWGSMALSPRLWAIIVAHFCYNWAFYTLLTCLPMYMNDVLHFNIKKNGLLSALPYLGCWLAMVLGGQVADHIRMRHLLSVTATRKVFTTLGLLGPGVFLVATGFVGCNYTLAVAFLTLSSSMGGLSMSGFNINHLDIAPQYAGILLGITNTFATIPGFLGPLVVGYLTPEHSLPEWQTVFNIAASVDAFGALAYLVLGSGELQDWAKDLPIHTHAQ
ncbi:sialin [Lampetra fluviatilis]